MNRALSTGQSDLKSPAAPSLRRWALGGSAVLGAGAAAHGATVEIDLTGNGISMIDGVFGSSLDLDLTGDGNDDFTNASFVGAAIDNADGKGISLQAGENEAKAFYGKRSYSWSYSTTFGKIENYKSTFTGFSLKVGYSSFVSYEPQELTGYIPVKFTDAGINGGSESNGWIQVRVASTGTDDHSIDLVKLIYDDESTEAPNLWDDGYLGDGDGWVYIDGEFGPVPVHAFFTKGGPRPYPVPMISPIQKKKIRNQIAVLEQESSSLEKRLARLLRGQGKSKVSTSRLHSRRVLTGEAAAVSRKLEGLRKKIRALKKQLRK